MGEKQHVEDPTVRWATNNGIKHRKMNGLGNRSWPDDLFYSRRFKPGTKGVFIEFKDKGKVPTAQQYEMMDELRSVGFDVAWFDNKLEAIAYLKGFLNAEYTQQDNASQKEARPRPGAVTPAVKAARTVRAGRGRAVRQRR